MHEKSGSLVEWVVPLCFILCAGWMVWHLPAFTLDWFPPDETAIPNLLITSLEQSPRFRVATWERLNDLLHQMGHDEMAA